MSQPGLLADCHYSMRVAGAEGSVGITCCSHPLAATRIGVSRGLRQHDAGILACLDGRGANPDAGVRSGSDHRSADPDFSGRHVHSLV
jgi:hypothetical protein